MTTGFVLPQGLKGRFGMVRLWPGSKTAENEVLARVSLAAQTLGITCVAITPDGHMYDDPSVKLTQDDLDFVIHLHFETPKAYDIFSFAALWNPLRFYYDYHDCAQGYRQFSDNLLSHDDYLSCRAPGADDHIRRLTCKDPTRLVPHFTLFHSLGGPLREPSLGAHKLFYAGINWDRLGKGKSRHQELLDLLDQSGRIHIHGPEILAGIKVWDGYQSYKGEIPFDGVSVLDAIGAAGVGLVLSSDAHKESGLMSNRLFESLAAGAMIICDENPFAKKHFGDTLLYIDTTLPAADVFQQIKDHLAWIDAHPDSALDMVRRAQDIMRANFSLDQSLAQIYSGFAARKAEMERPYNPSSSPAVTLFMVMPVFDPAVLDRHIQSVKCQTYPHIAPVLLINAQERKKHGAALAAQIKASGIAFDVRDSDIRAYWTDRVGVGKKGQSSNPGASAKVITRSALGVAVYAALQSVDAGALFCVVTEDEELFSTHIQSLVATLVPHADRGAAVGASTVIVSNEKTTSFENRTDGRFLSMEPRYALGTARVLLRRPSNLAALSCVVPYLNHRVCAFLALWADYVPCSRMTSLLRLTPAKDELGIARVLDFDREIMKDVLPLDVLRKEGGDAAGGDEPYIDIAMKISTMPTAKRLQIIRDLFFALPIPTFMSNLGMRGYKLMKVLRWKRGAA